jgi:hypothetical protein
LLVLATCLAAVATSAPTVSRAAETSVDAANVAFFEQHVRPLLVTHCYQCHSAESDIVQGSLLLDSKPGWEKGGDSGPAIVPGEPEKSLLLRAVQYSDDEDVQMPPKGKLAANEIAVLSQWISLGAPDPRIAATIVPTARKIDIERGRKHWAFQPLKAVKPPQVENDKWARTDVDRFIAEKFAEHGVHGNAIADRRTLVRRAYFDLLGLPPTPKQMDATLKDKSPDTDGNLAYERLIDELLENPSFGERWARHWLDLARFAESHGYEQDDDRPYAYPYRDFVIRAFNQDLPYDTFVRWQIAGDEIAPGDPLALAATGFLGAGVHATQITANQAEKERYDELDDMVRTMGTTMLGLTVGCARCHDHKYDPISNADYYKLVSIFSTTVRTDQFVNQDPVGYQTAVDTFKRRHDPLVEAREKYAQRLVEKDFDAWLANAATSVKLPRWTIMRPEEVGGDAPAKALDDDSVLCSLSNNLRADTRTITATIDAEDLRVIRLEVLPDSSLPRRGPGLSESGSFQLNEVKVQATSADGKRSRTVKFTNAWTAAKDKSIAGLLDDKPNTGWNVDTAGRGDVAVLVADKPFGFGEGTKLTFRLVSASSEQGIGRFRWSVSANAEPSDTSGDSIHSEAFLALRRLQRDPGISLNDSERAALQRWFVTLDEGWQKRDARVQASLRKEPIPELTRTTICTEGLPAQRLRTQGPDFYEKTFALKRGDPNQKVGEALPGYLQVLVNSPQGEEHWRRSPPEGSRTSYRRAALADWMTDTRYGAGDLLARVIVNRLWYYHMGRGLVATPSDFGLNGQPPSHPELLDWLAGELIRNGWRLKPIHKLIMTSAVYMQTCESDAERQRADVDNRWCWHRPMQRLEAESVRDAMLAVSGKLEPRMFGPGSLDVDQPRRSIYYFVKRSKLMPMITLFDGPDTLQDLAMRSETTIAPQSLLFLNSPMVRGCAEALANRVLRNSKDSSRDVGASIKRAYQLALSRNPTNSERRTSQEFVQAQLENYRNEDPDNADQLAWIDFCQALFCLNEFIYIK